MVAPTQAHLDGKIWIGGDNEYQVDMATGQWTAIDYRKGQPAGAKDHGSYGVAADSHNNFYGMELNGDNIIKVDAKTLVPTYYPTPTPNSGPRRGHFDNQDRLWFAENRGQNIAMFDAKTGKIQEWKIPTPYSTPYDAMFDGSLYAWTGGMGQRTRLASQRQDGRDRRLPPSVRNEYPPCRPGQVRDPVPALGRQQSQGPTREGRAAGPVVYGHLRSG
jgi:streptogramin lyase